METNFRKRNYLKPDNYQVFKMLYEVFFATNFTNLHELILLCH
ncbi:hypothetical protein C8C83_2408 [Flavobacterium sp. 90]|nr:hypothetical protein C8C82_2714 [Flavobacterium sp. 81]TCK54512.1 hypothetical protein C8C83_2408 [Flavobacterium sp. 90]